MINALNQNTTAFDEFQSAIAAGLKESILDCWLDFAHWERARNYWDDPSHPAKAAIEWIINMESARGELDEFQGDAMDECLAKLDATCEAFAKLKHSPELIHAIQTWKQWRKDEQTVM